MQNQANIGYVGAPPDYPQGEYPASYAQPGARLPQAVPVMMGQPSYRNMEIIVPNGAFGGSVLQITDPQTRNTFQVTVPAGLKPGMRFEVQLQQLQTSTAYQAPAQQPMVYQQRTDDKDDCGAFMMGMCFCCTLCCLTGS